MAERGRYVVVEGAEWMGKTTQAELLAGRSGATYVREPGTTAFGQRIRRLMIEQFEPVSGLTDVLLVNTARADTIDHIDSILSTGQAVVSDRNYLSTLAYQGYGQGVNLDVAEQVCAIATRGINPDVTIVLDAPDEVIDARKNAADTDKFELEDGDFHKRVREGYRQLAQRFGFVVVDAALSRQEAHNQIWQAAGL